MKVAVTRMGALFHYAIPRTVHSLGLLGQFYTDIWSGNGWGDLIRMIPPAFQPKPVKRLASRCVKEIPLGLVTDFPMLALDYGFRRWRANNAEEELYIHMDAGRRFCEGIIRHGLGDCDTLYSSNSQGLELLAHARQRGLRTFSEQTIAPYEFERMLIGEEEERFPGWGGRQEAVQEAGEAFSDRERQEWALCDRILCGADFVRDAIRSVGGPADKCMVVPYGFDFPKRKSEIRKRESRRPLRVLTVGTVCLRKGLPYVAETAETLRGEMEFRVVGPCRLLPDGLAKLRSSVELIGPVPRSEVQTHFDWADVFLFPSLCEGSATVCYEALASGLPVICTPNTGSVVRDGEDGFLVPIRDVGAIVERLQELDRDRSRLAAMSEAALARREFFTLDAYAARLRAALTIDA